MGSATARNTQATWPRYTVAHRSPGRVRLILDRGAEGDATKFAASIALQPATTEVRWVAAARSLTFRHDPAASSDEILARARLPRPPVVIVGESCAHFPGETLLRGLPRGGVPTLVFEFALRILAPPETRVLRRV